MDELTSHSEHLRGVLGHFFGFRAVDAVLSLVRPAARLRHDDSPDALKASWLGGLPVLPEATAWPTWGDRRLNFLGHLDFDEVARRTGVTVAGAAGFFYATEIPRPWGDDPAMAEGWRVVRETDGVAVAPPAGVEAFPERPVGVDTFLSLPAPEEPVVRALGDEFGEFDAVYAQVYRVWLRYVWPAGAPRHQVGGWPVLLGRPLWNDCARAAAGHRAEMAPADPDRERAAERDWRLMLQLDSDDRLGWWWGDEGLVYFTAKAGDLDRSWLILRSR